LKRRSIVASFSARLEVEPVRRQLGDSVRNDGTSEIDRLAAAAPKWYLCDSHLSSLPKQVLAAVAHQIDAVC
jgi:hypothetical protein